MAHYKKKDGSLYLKINSEDLANFEFTTNLEMFDNLCKEFDIPCVAELATCFVNMYGDNMRAVFGRYLQKMYLRGFKNFGYEDSEEVREYTTGPRFGGRKT